MRVVVSTALASGDSMRQAADKKRVARDANFHQDRAVKITLIFHQQVGIL